MGLTAIASAELLMAQWQWQRQWKPRCHGGADAMQASQVFCLRRLARKVLATWAMARSNPGLAILLGLHAHTAA